MVAARPYLDLVNGDTLKINFLNSGFVAKFFGAILALAYPELYYIPVLPKQKQTKNKIQ